MNNLIVKLNFVSIINCWFGLWTIYLFLILVCCVQFYLLPFSYSLRKQLTFGDATTGFPAKFGWETSGSVPKCWLFSQATFRASDISRGRGPAKFRYFREILWNTPKNAKYCEIRQKYFQIHVGKTYLILILAIRPVLFTPNVQIYLETSSLQRVNNVPKLPGVFRWTLRKTGH